MYRRPLLQRLAPPSVAVFRARHLGSMLCAVPALRALRTTLPRAHVTLVGLPWAREFARRFPAYVDAFIPLPGPPLSEQPVRSDALGGFRADLRARRFALALQMHGSDDASNDLVRDFGAQATAGCHRGALVVRDGAVLLPGAEIGAEPERLLALVGQLGATATGTHLEFPLSTEDEDALHASGLGDVAASGDYLCVHPGAHARDTCWPARLFAEVADRLAAEFGLQVVLTGTPGDADRIADVAAHMRHTPIDASALPSTGALAALLHDASLLLCNDGGVSQVAAGLRLKSVVVFSRADIARWAPLDRHAHRCIWDPDGERAKVVLQHARTLLACTTAGGQRSAGMWPYW